MRRRHLLLAAVSPLCLAAAPALAETVISTSVTTPVATGTAAAGQPDDVRISADGAVQPAGGAAVTLNSDNDVTVEGLVKIQNADDATGLLVAGGSTGEVKLSGAIQIDESAEIKDADGDGDNDGPFASGARRFGVRVTGPAAFQGSIVQTGGAINIEGVDSAAVSAESAVAGSIRLGGTVTVSGDRSYGLHAASTVGGDVAVTGGLSVQGAGAVGVALDDNVGGRLIIGSAVTATGFRYTARPADAALAKLDADDLLIGGAAVRVGGDVVGGVLVDAPPADNDPDDADEDDDGVPDNVEASGAISSFGSAPGLLIGAQRAIQIGAVGAGADAYGLVVKGTVSAAGVYDGVTATGIQLGGLGGAVNIAGGIRNAGTVQASAVKAAATALHLGVGTDAATLINAGAMRATSTSTDAVEVSAVRIDAGATLASLDNSGTLSAVITGAKGSATAVLDAAGSLRNITNSNLIAAGFAPAAGDTVSGQGVALDLRANTEGVTVRQVANPTATIAPTISGDVLFGAGDAHLELMAGVLNGTVAFGAGADTLTIGGGARMSGVLTDAGGGLAVDVGAGRLTVTNASAIDLTSFHLGPTGELVVTFDPATGATTRLNVAGAAAIDTGAKVGVRFASKLSEPTTYTLLHAGSLSAGTIDQSLLGTTPWLYKAEVRVDTAAGDVLADVRRRSAAEAGLDAAETAAYDAVFDAFDRDAGVREALLGKTDEGSFRALYDQLLPDYSGGLFQALAVASEATGRAIDHEPRAMDADGLRVWTQELGFIVKRDAAKSGGYDASGFGLAAGVEAPDTILGTIGLQTSFVTLDVDEDHASAKERLGGEVFMAGGYWRDSLGGLNAILGLSGGYASLDSTRTLFDLEADLEREAKSDWSGGVLSAHAALNYQFDIGRVGLQPLLSADYLLLKEGDRSESGGGAAMDLDIDKRSSSQLAAFAGVALSARFGAAEDFVWAPELTLGWRQVSGKGPGDTTARFLSGGDAFTLASQELSGGGGAVRVGLRGHGQGFDVGIEGGGEMRDDYEAYDARVTARVRF